MLHEFIKHKLKLLENIEKIKVIYNGSNMPVSPSLDKEVWNLFINNNQVVGPKRLQSELIVQPYSAAVLFQF